MSSYLEDVRRRQERAIKVQFRDDEFMIGSPDCSLAAFKTPRLRQCPFDLSTISLEACLGGGMDGYVWKVKFGDSGPFALKVFWDTQPDGFFQYHSVQRECQNAALFQMIETSIAQSTPESPILVNANPKTRKDALCNHYAFSTDGRARVQQKLKESSPTNTKIISEVPRLRQCYGWLNFSGRIIRRAHYSLWPPPLRIDKVDRQMPFNQDYIAIVYEYIEGGENDPAVVEQTLEFLWLAGFSLVDSPLARNWTSGVLLDLCDIVPPRRSCWESENYGIRDVEMVLRS